MDKFDREVDKYKTARSEQRKKQQLDRDSKNNDLKKLIRAKDEELEAIFELCVSLMEKRGYFVRKRKNPNNFERDFITIAYGANGSSVSNFNLTDSLNIFVHYSSDKYIIEPCNEHVRHSFAEISERYQPDVPFSDFSDRSILIEKINLEPALACYHEAMSYSNKLPPSGRAFAKEIRKREKLEQERTNNLNIEREIKEKNPRGCIVEIATLLAISGLAYLVYSIY